MPREIKDQVVVVTGASSGIGHGAARAFGAYGAKVVLAARRLDALQSLAEEINRSDGQAVAVQTDVSQAEQVEHLAKTAVEHFGRIDTWVNDAGVSVYGQFEKLTEPEIRRVIDVKLLGPIYGMRAALPAMELQGQGTIINIASVAGKRGFPLQSIYSASKFALVGLGESLRAELHRTWPRIAVCTICPPSVNTSFFDNARSKEGYAPRPFPPVYATEKVVKAILGCAVHPRREIVVSGAGKMLVFWNRLAGGLMDQILSRAGMTQQLSGEPKSEADPANLFEPSPRTDEHGDWTHWGGRRPRTQ